MTGVELCIENSFPGYDAGFRISIMSKNAISLLQEYRQKRAQPLPTYDEICATVGMHPNKFKFSCTCGLYKSDGEGPNKKDAKANAAEAMINILRSEKEFDQCSTGISDEIQTQPQTFHDTVIPSVLDLIGFTSASLETITYPPLSSSSCTKSDDHFSIKSNTAVVNSIGRLQELCVRTQLKAPSYRNFAMSNGFQSVCTIGTQEAYGTASTKKQAKHNSADVMLNILTEKYPQLAREDAHRINTPTKFSTSLPLLDLNLDELKISSPKKEENITNKVKNLFPNLKRGVGISKLLRNTSFKNFHIILKNSLDPKVISTFHNFYKSVEREQLLNMHRLEMSLNEICTILGVENETRHMKVKDRRYMVEFKLNTYPPISNIEIEPSLTIAQLKCLSRFIYKIHFLLL